MGSSLWEFLSPPVQQGWQSPLPKGLLWGRKHHPCRVHLLHVHHAHCSLRPVSPPSRENEHLRMWVEKGSGERVPCAGPTIQLLLHGLRIINGSISYSFPHNLAMGPSCLQDASRCSNSNSLDPLLSSIHAQFFFLISHHFHFLTPNFQPHWTLLWDEHFPSHSSAHDALCNCHSFPLFPQLPNPPVTYHRAASLEWKIWEILNFLVVTYETILGAY